MLQNDESSSMLKNVSEALTLIFFVIGILVLPIMFLYSLRKYWRVSDPKERNYRLLSSLEMFCYCYVLYGFAFIPILHNVFEEWAIWSYYPSVWASLAGYSDRNLIMGVMGDAFCCLLMIPLFSLWSRWFGYTIDDVFYAN